MRPITVEVQSHTELEKTLNAFDVLGLTYVVIKEYHNEKTSLMLTSNIYPIWTVSETNVKGETAK